MEDVVAVRNSRDRLSSKMHSEKRKSSQDAVMEIPYWRVSAGTNCPWVMEPLPLEIVKADLGKVLSNLL